MRRALAALLLVASAAPADQVLVGLCSSVESVRCTAVTPFSVQATALTPTLVSPLGAPAAFQFVVTEGQTALALSLTDVLTLTGALESGTNVAAIFLTLQKADASGSYGSVASAVVGDVTAACGCPFVQSAMTMTARDLSGGALGGAPLLRLGFGEERTVALDLTWAAQGISPGDQLRLQPCVAWQQDGVSRQPGCFSDTGGGGHASRACTALPLPASACVSAPSVLVETLGALSSPVATLGGFTAATSAPGLSPPSLAQTAGGAAVSFTDTPSGVAGRQSAVTVQGLATCGLAQGTATLTGSASIGASSSSATLSLSCPGAGGAGSISVGDFCTYTQGGWGAACKGKNPGCVRDTFFDKVFTTPLPCSGEQGLTLGASAARRANFGNASAVKGFLPQGGTAGAFSGPLCDPTTSSAGVFAGQLLALKLNVGFSDAGYLPKKGAVALGDLVMTSGPCAGFSARQVLARGENAISGLGSSGSACLSVGDLATAADAINNDFDDCTQDQGALRLP